MASDNKQLLAREDIIPFFPSELFGRTSGFRELPFDPWFRPASSITTSFLKLLMDLPKEIRDKIYGYLAFPGGPKNVYGRFGTSYIERFYTKNKPNPFNLALPTYSKPIYTRAENKVMPTPTDYNSKVQSWNSRNRKYWEVIHRRGVLHTFERRYMKNGICQEDQFCYEYLLRYVYGVLGHCGALLTQDGVWEIDEKENKDAVKPLLDFLEWFWREITLGILLRSFEWLKEKPQIFNRIQNLSLELYPNTQNPLKSDSRNNERAITSLLKLISTTFPHLQNLSLWLALCNDQVEKLMLNPGWMRWVYALREIKIGGRFELHIIVAFDERESVVRMTDREKHENQLGWQEKLHKLFMPISLSVGTTNDLPDNFGLGWLFGDEN